MTSFPSRAVLDGTSTPNTGQFKTAMGQLYDAVTRLSGDGSSSIALRNRIINGNFAVNQRAVSGTVTLAAGAYGHDRWKAGASGCTYTFATSGVDTVITISAGSLMQVIEDKNVEGGTYAVSHAGTAQARIAVSGGATSGAYAAASQAAPLLSGSATGGQSMTVEFSTGTVDRVMVEPGSISTNFERTPNDQALSRCKRYYQTYAGLGYRRYVSNVDRFTYLLPVEMRATPTVNSSITGGTNIQYFTVSPTSKTNIVQVEVQYTSGGTGVVDTTSWSFTADAEL